MKNPLRYQLTEYDCGPASMLNAISYLFERKDITTGGDPEYYAVLSGLSQQGRCSGKTGDLKGCNGIFM